MSGPSELSWTITADGDQTPKQIYPSGPVQIEATGTFGNGTITLKSATGATNANALTIPGVAFTAAGRSNQAYAVVRGEWFTPVMTGSTNPNVVFSIRPVVA